jgi:hypothetical protein
VIERMGAIAATLPPEDGVASFNELYLAVTRELVGDTSGFEDRAFLERLDILFAELYFSAVDADEHGRALADAWEPLFEARGRRKVARIQFALAGMNAHINYDLAVALLEAHEELGLELKRDSPQHRDYLKVNELLARVEERIKEGYAEGLVGIADDALGRLDDVLAMWKVARARDAAWTHAEALRALGTVPGLAERYLRMLGRFVGLAGRGLLIPTL